MTAVLNTNMTSLYAQKSLNTAQTELASSVQRLSSGQRIVGTKDDAAGYALSEAIKATKAISDQSARNTKNAISTVQVAEGALDAVGKILQRVLTLSTQKENDVLSQAQRTSANEEIASLLNEVQKIKERSKLQSSQVSVFGSSIGLMPINDIVTTIDIADLSLLGVESQAPASSSLIAGPAISSLIADHTYRMEIDGPLLAYNGPLGYFAARAGNEFDAQIENGVITFTAPGVGQDPFDITVGGTLSFHTVADFGGTRSQAISVDDASQALIGDTIYINGGILQNAGSNVTVEQVIGNVIVTSMRVGFITTNPLQIDEGDLISFGNTSNSTQVNANLPANTVYFDNTDLIVEVGGIITGAPGYDATGPLITEIGDWFAKYTINQDHPLNAGNETPSVYYHVTVQALTDITSPTASPTGRLQLVGNSSLDSEAAHAAGLIARSDYVDGNGNPASLNAAAVNFLSSNNVMKAIQMNSTNRSDLGAWLNRLDYTLDSMQTLANNLADGISRILDTDYAAETAKLTRGQILQQATTSMLAQANQLPNVVLMLLE
jgi:flagellin